jgi:hypothetical protein
MKKLSLFALFLFLSSCSTYTISKQSLLEQLNNQSLSKTNNIGSIGTDYYSNGLQKIICVDKNGKEVILNANKNTSFVITNALTGKSTSLYFDTVYIENDSLKGLKSRIVGGKRSIALSEVSTVKITTEN